MVVPRQFRENPGNLENMDPDSFSLFTCEMPQRADLDRVRGLVAKAERIVGRVDALVFPELALPPGDAVRLAKELQRVVIGGEGAPADPHTRSAGLNAAIARSRSDRRGARDAPAEAPPLSRRPHRPP